MLEIICGNRSIQKILLFLFVNRKCYGMQLHHLLKTPLTPIQKALLRLEKGGVIQSCYEGRTRLYRMDPSFPLAFELEQLLKKAYMLLPSEEQREYYVAIGDSVLRPTPLSAKNNILIKIWEKLSQVTQITFHAKSNIQEKEGWSGLGKGIVTVAKEEKDILIFKEKGSWEGKQNDEIHFSNVYRWTLDCKNYLISLEHLRYGIDRPIFLLQLTPSGPHSLTSLESHLCEGDLYFGQIHLDRYSLRLKWRVIGPKKNEEIDYYYS
jgi:hypothetical protein